MKRAIFIGRWSPFHKGHLAIMQKKIDEGKPLLILIRDTHYDLYPPLLRKRMIEATMAKLKVDAKVVIIDDIESVNYGRGVGYEVNEIEVPDSIKAISATQIREMIEKKDNSWKNFMPSGADNVLETYLTKKGMVIWLTGLPKSGKTTIAKLTESKLEERGIAIERLDSNILRKTISKDLGFTKEDRSQNLERATFIANLLSKNSAIVICSFISPYEIQRKQIKSDIEKNAGFIEVFVKATVESCKKRDETGMYKKAENGQVEDFTGVSAPYEEPKNPDLVLETEKYSAEECANKLADYIEKVI